MVDIYSSPYFQAALVWVFIGMITIGTWPKSKAPWIIQYLVAVFMIVSWPVLLMLARRR